LSLAVPQSAKGSGTRTKVPRGSLVDEVV
jgi:hypothetical protein